jgi:hypothetical protein
MKNVVTSSLNDEMIAHTCIIRCPTTLLVSELKQEDEPVSKKLKLNLPNHDSVAMLFSLQATAVSCSSALSTSTSPNGFCCEWQGTIFEAQNHIQECASVPINCSNLGCSQVTLRSQLNAHHEVCPNRIVVCAHCQDNIVLCEMEIHEGSCRMRTMMLCPNGCVSESTGEPRVLACGSLKEHLEVCEEQEVVCEFSEFGCRVRGTRKTIKAHVGEAGSGIHTQLLLSTINDLKRTVVAKEVIIADQQRTIKEQGAAMAAEKATVNEIQCTISSMSTAKKVKQRSVLTASCKAPATSHSTLPPPPGNIQKVSPQSPTAADVSLSYSVLNKGRIGADESSGGRGLQYGPHCMFIELYNAVLCGHESAWLVLRNKSAARDLDLSNVANVYVMLLYQSGTAGSLVTVDISQANDIAASLLPWFQKEVAKTAETGNVNAIFGLACCHYFGLVLPVNNEEAVKLLRIAHERGHVIATSTLGCCYWNGHGLKKDESKSTAFYTRAAEAGCIEAMCNVGMNFDQKGRSSSRNRKKAFSWYLRAANMGHCTSQYNVGVCYLNKYGVKKDEVEGERWLQLAADQGYPLAVEYFEDTDSDDVAV